MILLAVRSFLRAVLPFLDRTQRNISHDCLYGHGAQFTAAGSP
jgi:hypothetical protein